MTRYLIVLAGIGVLMFGFNSAAMAAEVDCAPFSLACGYTIQVGPFDIDVLS